MKKIIPKKINKIWGYELWLNSPIAGQETTLEDGTKTTEGPLIKIIKANQPLSVQVHPDDEMAREVEKQPNGKSESWYVLESKPDSAIVAGLKTYDKEVIRKCIQDNSFEDLLNYVKVEKEGFYNIPSGLVHALGKGITVLEVQQPSDTTYRYYDYNRLENGQKRELHIDKALMAQKDIDFVIAPSSKNPLTYQTEYKQIFVKDQEYCVTEKTIVIDLDSYESYIAENEKINLKNFALISFN